MPRRCTICDHSQSEAIDAAVIAGASYRTIAKRFQVSPSALGRHVRRHLIKTLAAARNAEEVANGNDLLSQVQDLSRQAQNIKDKAEAMGDLKTALAGIRELVRIVELLARLRGELDERPVVNVLVSPQWIEVRAVLLGALSPYPEARAAAAEALLEVSSGQ